MHAGYSTLDLKARVKTLGDVPGGEGIEFLSIDFSNDPSNFLVLVNFSVYGQPSELSLRIDLDKEAFLDDAYGPPASPKSFSAEQLTFLAQAAPRLASMFKEQISV